jgi:hypothetical protein
MAIKLLEVYLIKSGGDGGFLEVNRFESCPDYKYKKKVVLYLCE